MTAWERDRAVDRLAELVRTVERETMPVPIHEIWVYGDLALGLDPVDRIEVYLTKDILLGGDDDRRDEFVDSYDIEGVGETVRTEWAEANPEYLVANAAGYAAPEECLAEHLLERDESVHLEVCNASFEDNVTQRLEGAMATGSYEEILDPRAVCLWLEGRRSTDAFEKLRQGEYAFPTLADSLEMLGLAESEAREAAEYLEDFRAEQAGRTVRGDIV